MLRKQPVPGNYLRYYSLNVVGRHQATITVAIPPKLLQILSRKHSMPIYEFVKQYYAVANFDNEGNLSYKFEKIVVDNENGKQ